VRKRAIIFITSGLALLIAASRVQAAPPDFSGDWKLNTAKSDYGPIPAPEVMTRKIKHADPSLAYTTYQKGEQGEVTTDIKYTTDGKPTVNKLPTGDAKGSAKWDGDKLIVDSTRETQGTELKFHETWELSEGGKVLTVSNHITVPQGEFDVKLVFDKQ
jgi:hypothetical protein